MVKPSPTNDCQLAPLRICEREREVRTFLIKLVANIRTSVSGRKLWTAARYPMRFCWYLAEDMTSRTLKEAQDMSWPIISR